MEIAFHIDSVVGIQFVRGKFLIKKLNRNIYLGYPVSE